MSIVDTSDEFKEIICTVKTVVQDKSIEFNVHEDLDINYEKLELEMDNFPQVFHLWSMIYSEIKEQQDSLETQIKKRRAHLTKFVLDNSKSQMRKSDIDCIVDCDDELLKLDAQSIMLEKKSRKLFFTLEALRMKNDNMRSLAGFKRQEMMNS